MDHDQLFKAVLTAQLQPFLELFFADEAAQLDLPRARFVDKELFAAPPMGPVREVDLLVDVPLRAGGAGKRAAGSDDTSHTLVAIQIEVQSQHEPEFIWRNAEYYVLLRRLRGLPVFPIALFPLADVLGRSRGRRPAIGYEWVSQRDSVLGHIPFEFSFAAVTLRALDSTSYLARPQALAGALAARMRPATRTSRSQHKLACLRRIIEGSGVEREETRTLLADVAETYLPLQGSDAEQFDQLLQEPENQGVRQQMKTWSEQQQEIGEAREARQAVLRVLAARFGPVPPAVAARIAQMEDLAALEALLERAATAASLAETGLA